MVAVASRPGQGLAAQFPAHNPNAGGPRAVIAITNTTAADAMNPGTSRFVFGADFRVDSTTAVNTAYDNGNNLVQRGLYHEPAQFKVEIDRNRAVCRVKGSAGSITVRSAELSANRWYRALCERVPGSHDTLRITLTDLSTAVRSYAVSSRQGTIGSVDFSLARPMSVGGKLASAGRIASSSDQFNGAVDNVLFRIG